MARLAAKWPWLQRVTAPGRRARNAPLAHLVEHLAGLDPQRPTAVVCAGGYLSTAGTSILQRLGFRQFFNVVGGTSAWINAGHPVAIGLGATAQES